MTRRLLLRGAVAGLISAALVALASWFNPSLFGLEWLFYDPAVRSIARSDPPDPRIVIVAINETSFRALEPEYGRYPFNREVVALVTDTLREAGARAIAFDLIFSGEEQRYPEGDRTFASALAASPSILAATTEDQPPLPIDAGYAKSLWKVDGARSWPIHRLVSPHPLFRTAHAIGTIRFAPGSATARRYLALDRVSEEAFAPSLGLAAAALDPAPERRAAVLEGTLRAGGYTVPVDQSGTFAIRWHLSKDADEHHISYPVVEISKVVTAAVARPDPAAAGIDPTVLKQFMEQFREKIVIVGLTATGAEGLDLRATPLSPVTAGVEIHANAIDDLISGHFNRDAAPIPTLLAIILIAALCGAVLEISPNQIVSGAIAVLIIAGWLAAGYLLLREGIIIRTAAGAGSIVGTFIVVTTVKFVYERRHSAELKATFGRYVSPQVLDHILAHPELLHLGGERRDLTILFSDIRGFTSISEAAEPEEVVEMLNEYLTRMVEILLRHGGTLDKFIGDAVMGFWNAPAADPDHARHSVECAVEMIEETARIRERRQTEGKTGIRIGIGINTGEAVVGNIGSEQVLSYTVIGDAVNLASRLEGKNKDYGTEIIVSEFTLARIEGLFQTVYLDEVKVKGKEKPVRIFEVKGSV